MRKQRKQLSPSLFWVLYLCFTLQVHFCPLASAQSAAKESTGNSDTAENTADFSTWGTEKLFNDPAWQSGIASGTTSLNHSIDLLMETIFYNLLDNELVYNVNDTTQFAVGLRRDLYSAQTGQYVVVDRFSIGPRYLKEIMQEQKIPIRLGGDVSTNVFSIYLRSDAIRLNEDLEQPFLRVVCNNWLGLLPVLSAILPPSFNANALYDPIRQVTTPFQLPLTADAVDHMEIGSIRSYSLTGGVYIGFDILERYQEQITQALGQDFKLVTTLPYSVFRTGEHRINVLRKNEHVAWVGLSESKQTGHGIDAHFGKLYLILSKVVNVWKGVNAPIFPLNIKKIRENIDKIEMIYSFDLRVPSARIAYEQAVSGNFTYASALQEKWEKEKKDNGVRFEYRANTVTDRSESETDNSFFVQRVKNQRALSKSEIEVTDTSGKFSILEAKATDTHENWNVLIGQKSINYDNRYQILVKKVPTAKNSAQYLVDDSARDPYNLTLSFRALDRYCDAEDFVHYLDQARTFAMLPLKNITEIPIRDKEVLSQYREKYALDDPTSDIDHIRVTPTYLGEFRLDSSIYFSSQALGRIERLEEKAILGYFLSAYDIKWLTLSGEHGLIPAFLRAFDWAALLLTYPFRLIDIDMATTDAFLEINNGILAFRQIKQASTPSQKVHGYKMLLDTNHPARLAVALLKMSRPEEVSRSINLGTISKGDKQSSSYKQFNSLNRKNFFSETRPPDTSRYRNLQDKFDQLLPTSVHGDHSDVPLKVLITKNEVPRLIGTTFLEEAEIFVSICSNKIHAAEAKFFVRLEQSGKVNLGRFVLVEKVLLLKADEKSTNSTTSCFKFALTGPSSPFTGFILDNVLSIGGDLELIIAASEDGSHWGDKNVTSFHVIDGSIIQDKG